MLKDTIVLRHLPCNMHVHWRQTDLPGLTGNMMAFVAPFTRSAFPGYVVVMPNTAPPLNNLEAIKRYQQDIEWDVLNAPRAKNGILFTLYLTDDTPVEVVKLGLKTEVFDAIKIYFNGATTNSAAGVTSIDAIADVLNVVNEWHKRGTHRVTPVLIHCEEVYQQTDSGLAPTDPFDREKVFLPTFAKLLELYPNVPFVFEHISSAEGVGFISQMYEEGKRIAATITPHHLWYTRFDLLHGGLQEHCACMPVVKTLADREALIGAATSGLPCFFAGTDSAPHNCFAIVNPDGSVRGYTKEGRFGSFCEPAAIPTYLEVFECARGLAQLEGFLALHGPRFYGRAPLPCGTRPYKIEREPWVMPPFFTNGNGLRLRPMRAEETIPWRIRGWPDEWTLSKE